MKKFSLTYKQLRNSGFLISFDKLFKYNGVSTNIAIQLKRIKKTIDAEMETAQEFFTQMIKKHAELKEDGSIKPIDENQPDTFKIREEEKANWFKAVEEFEKVEFEVPAMQIGYDDLNGAPLSAADLLALDPILSEGFNDLAANA